MSFTSPARHHETDMGPAIRRFKRFATVAIVATGALYMVLAVKAQVLPKPYPWDNWPGYEQLR